MRCIVKDYQHLASFLFHQKCILFHQQAVATALDPAIPMTVLMQARKNFGFLTTLGQTLRGLIADTKPRKRDAQPLRMGG